MAARRDATRVVEHELRIEAPPETVFPYFTDPAKIVEWMGEEATLDPRPGGFCRIAFAGGAVAGSFVEVEPPTRVVFTWGWEERFFDVPPGDTRVEVTLAPEGDATRVRLTHTKLPPSAVGFHDVGWRHYLARLGECAAGRDPGPDDLVNVGRKAAVE
ncbi:MAG TPA: SRPBCC domain-containing protein [Thermoleophilaceae bacterium]|nr:SRPBCC domain-containing protein [Thermoleophilaceae bacterium]